MAFSKLARRSKIKSRIRGKVSGTASKPRLSVFRSNKEIYAQLVDDLSGVTLTASGSLNLKEAKGVSKTEQASIVGKSLAQKAADKGITEVVFDRNGYLYHGRVKALADAAREAGLKF